MVLDSFLSGLALGISLTNMVWTWAVNRKRKEKHD